MLLSPRGAAGQLGSPRRVSRTPFALHPLSHCWVAVSVTPSGKCTSWTPSPPCGATPLGLPKLGEGACPPLRGEAGRLLAVSSHQLTHCPLPFQLLGMLRHLLCRGERRAPPPWWVISLRGLRPLAMGRSICPIVVLDTELPGGSGIRQDLTGTGLPFLGMRRPPPPQGLGLPAC